MVFHDQNYDMNKELAILEESLTHIGWSKHCVHAGPVIRSEEEYKGYSIKDRQGILKRMMSFVRHLDIRFKTIMIEKKHINDSSYCKGSREYRLPFSSLRVEGRDHL